MLLAQSGGAACSLGPHYLGLLQEPSLESGRSVWEAALGQWSQCPVLVPPQAWSLVPAPQQGRVPMTNSVSCHREEQNTEISLAVTPSPGLASCPPKFQEDFSATANTGLSLPDEDIGLTHAHHVLAPALPIPAAPQDVPWQRSITESMTIPPLEEQLLQDFPSPPSFCLHWEGSDSCTAPNSPLGWDVPGCADGDLPPATCILCHPTAAPEETLLL